MGVQEFARKVLANKEDYSSTTVKRANFAKNAAGWKKQTGGQASRTNPVILAPTRTEDPVYNAWAEQQQAALRRSGVSQMPSANDMYKFYTKEKPLAYQDQYGNYVFSNQTTLGRPVGGTYTQRVNQDTGVVMDPSRARNQMIDAYYNRGLQMGGQIGIGDTMELDESEIQRLMDMGYGVSYID